MIQVTAAVKDDRVDALGLRALGNQLADRTGRGLVAAVALDLLIERGSRNERVAGDIVDDLGIDVLLTAEYVQAGSFGCTGDLGTEISDKSWKQA